MDSIQNLHNKTDDDAFKIIIKKIFDISYIREKLSNNVNVKINFDINDNSIIDKLYEAGDKFPGDSNLILHVLNNQGQSDTIQSAKLLISNDTECLQYLKNIIGSKNVWLS